MHRTAAEVDSYFLHDGWTSKSPVTNPVTYGKIPLLTPNGRENVPSVRFEPVEFG